MPLDLLSRYPFNLIKMNSTSLLRVTATAGWPPISRPSLRHVDGGGRNEEDGEYRGVRCVVCGVCCGVCGEGRGDGYMGYSIS